MQVCALLSCVSRSAGSPDDAARHAPALQGHIGLNEVAIGISVPLYWGCLMARIVGDRVAESFCSFARLVSPQEALKVSPSPHLVAPHEPHHQFYPKKKKSTPLAL